ncbi:MAG: sugar transferase [Pseudomonadota bacterium]
MNKFDTKRPVAGLMKFARVERALALPEASAGARSTAGKLPWQAARTPLVLPHLRAYRTAGKRALDVALVVLSLPFTLPIIALCALSLWLEGGAPFYTQKRVGRGGQSFDILKLRTMVRDADAVLARILREDPQMRAEWDSLQKLKNDPRITPVGRFLRATSLDELPQLLNVLKGDMSLVGPRPMMLDQKALYGDMRAYAALRPGITGLWQVGARNGNTFAYRNEIDAAYEADVTFAKDVSILARTVGVVLRGTGY